jgi:spermidine synthase
MTRIEIRTLQRASREEILRLYREAGWCETGEEDNTRWIGRLLAGSLCALGAFEGGKLVGMGRAISDGACDAYVQDVIVLPSRRGRGIGGKILQEILKFVRGRGCRWVGLIARPGSEGFYRQAGFRVMPGHRAMLLQTKPGRDRKQK